MPLLLSHWLCFYFICSRGKAARGEKAFRESFARLAELRSIAKPGECGICEARLHYHNNQVTGINRLLE